MVVMVLTGCASGPAFDTVASTMQPTAAQDGRLFIYRPSALGAAIQPSVRLNEEIIGTAKPRGFFYVDRPAGTYVVSASTEAKRSLSVNLEPGDEKYIRLEMKIGVLAGHVKPVLVEKSVGLEELKKTKYIGADKPE